MKRLAGISLTIMVATVALCAGHQPGEKILVNRTSDGLAVQGYDPVAYFEDHKPVKGNSKFSSQYDGAIYRFATAGHKASFDANPEKYAPAYGGYCGYAASIDRLSPISPEWFQIVDGKLVLQHNKTAFDKWNSDPKGNLAKAEQNWPGLLARNGTSGAALIFTDKRGVALDGYDPVSYFKGGKPEKGSPAFESTYNGALYHFTSLEHRVAFEGDPAKYVPAYGGYCGYAASIGKVRPANPLIWSIVDGTLIVQHTKGAAELWEKDVLQNKAKADRLWPRLVKAKAGKRDPIDSLLGASVLGNIY